MAINLLTWNLYGKKNSRYSPCPYENMGLVTEQVTTQT